MAKKPHVVPAVFEDGQLTLYGDLPDKFSDLLELALGDLKRVERLSQKYHVDMSTWHAPNGVCSVCFAGSVMAGALGAGSDMHLAPEDYDHATAQKLNALDIIRGGDLRDALETIGVQYDDELLAEKDLQYIFIPNYHQDPLAFKKVLYQLAKNLRAIGL